MGEAQRDEIAKLEALYAANPEGRVFTHLAEAYRKAGNLERAREILEEGLSRHPDSGTAFVVLGRVAYDSDRPEDAREAFGRALTLDGGNLVAHRYLGELALARGDRESARRHFEELLARNPTDESLLARLRELSAPTFEDQPLPAPDAPALAEPPQPDDRFSNADFPAEPAARAGEPEDGETWTLPSDGFGGEAEEGDPLPTLELEPVSGESAADLGTSAEPWSWDEPSAEQADFAGLEDPGTIEGFAGGWDEPGLDSELPHLEGLEALPQFDAAPPEAADFAEPATWLADEREAPEAEGVGLPWLTPEPEWQEPPPADEALTDEALADEAPADEALTDEAPAEAVPADEGGTPTWRPYAVGDEAVADALADAGAVESSEAWPSEPEVAPAAGLLPGRPDDVMTETIADLYLTQGFAGRAADVYRTLLLRHPDDARLQERLAEAERRAAAETAPAAHTDDAWADGGESAGTGVAGATGAETAGAAGPPIADYFRSLLEWRASAGPDVARVDAAAEATPAAEAPGAWAAAPAPESAPTAASPGEALEDAPEATASWEAGDGWALTAAEEAEAAPESELVLEPEAEVLPELVLDEPASEAESFDGWTPDMLLDTSPTAPERMPWEVPEPESLASPPADPGAADVAPAAEPAGGAERELGAAQVPEPEAVTEEEEDEDLEMFRSWLQSLKK